MKEQLLKKIVSKIENDQKLLTLYDIDIYKAVEFFFELSFNKRWYNFKWNYFHLEIEERKLICTYLSEYFVVDSLVYLDPQIYALGLGEELEFVKLEESVEKAVYPSHVSFSPPRKSLKRKIGFELPHEV